MQYTIGFISYNKPSSNTSNFVQTIQTKVCKKLKSFQNTGQSPSSHVMIGYMTINVQETKLSERAKQMEEQSTQVKLKAIER